MMSSILLFLIRCYQLVLSPLVGANCRFQPSCSHYMHQAIEQYGTVQGLWLGIKRLLRCRPGAKWGYDPIPQPGCKH